MFDSVSKKSTNDIATRMCVEVILNILNIHIACIFARKSRKGNMSSWSKSKVSN